VAEAHPFPLARWLAVVWLAVWVPAYAITWGWANFLLFCDMAVILTCIGLWGGNRLLLSAQAVGSVVPDALWTLDVLWRLALGRHLFGGTEYMWDAQYALWIRLLSCFHVIWPVVVVCAVRRVGYDRRAWLAQTGLTAVLMVAARFLDPAKNMNYAFSEPLFHRTWGPAPVHIAVVLLFIMIVLYWPVHYVLLRTFGARTANEK